MNPNVSNPPPSGLQFTFVGIIHKSSDCRNYPIPEWTARRGVLYKSYVIDNLLHKEHMWGIAKAGTYVHALCPRFGCTNVYNTHSFRWATGGEAIATGGQCWTQRDSNAFFFCTTRYYSVNIALAISNCEPSSQSNNYSAGMSSDLANKLLPLGQGWVWAPHTRVAISNRETNAPPCTNPL